MKCTQLAGLFLTLALLGGCTAEAGTPGSAPAAVQTFQNVTIDSGFDTVITLVEQTADQTAYQEHFNEMCRQFSYYNSLFDIYNDYEGINNLKTINDNAGKQPVKVDPALIDLLDTAQELYELSDGAFDITIGSLLSVWHEARTEGLALNEQGAYGSLPDQSVLMEAAEHRGFEHIVIDRENNTVYIDDPQVKLDAGGIAKGFAAERTAQVLEEKHCDHAAINAGGNNRTIGSKYDGSPWNVGIQNPDGEGPLFVVQVKGTNSFVTSGDYERFYIAEDKRRLHHIIDPVTLFPAEYSRSVTIITKDSGHADCLSTALFVLPYEDGLNVLKNYTEQTGNPAEAIWIMKKDNAPASEYSFDKGEYRILYTPALEGSIVRN